ncbi:MAG: tRNA (adenosine(37)-N6)-threonylcarbamoyltransferase complex ATPase subunit type 1 TsaE [Candidatus Levybacteria bacterium]|nr:tRNA (adenosine(37)-N6)-threonylcarbamoyltransferase complex ATPase subunit type 1 TsaE [Candidatus Levybacteria bacterium]
MEKIIEVNNEDQTIKAGEEFASKLRPGDIVFLHGELGSGKTTFTKGIANGLGVVSRVASPTFIVVRTHPAQNQLGIKTLYHLDLYRLENEKQTKEIDLQGFLSDPEGVVVIEWPEIGQNLVNKKVWDITIEQKVPEGRKITTNYA